MELHGSERRWGRWLAVGLAAVGVVVLGSWLFFLRGGHSRAAAGRPAPAAGQPAAVYVQVSKPRKGGLERATAQPGEAHAFRWARLYSEVSGYLKTQNVDIGDRVKKDEVVAEISVPDRRAQEEVARASLEAAQEYVQVAQARVATAEANLAAAKAAVPQYEAGVASAAATARYRTSQYNRIRELAREQSIDQRTVDEQREERDAAIAAEDAARAAVANARALVKAAEAKVKQANADVLDARAKVKIAEAALKQAQVMVNFAIIRSPYTGVITRRRFHEGSFIRAGALGGEAEPLLTVAQTDKMRVITQVPDRDVPYLAPGEPATITFDALPGKVFHSTVARIAKSEDPTTRLMRTEIDLPNRDGRIEEGMYGSVKIVLQRGNPNALVVPSSSLVPGPKKGETSVYVVRDNKAHLVPVRVGIDNGKEAEILAGLTPDDEVVTSFAGSLGEGAPVVAAPAPR